MNAWRTRHSTVPRAVLRLRLRALLTLTCLCLALPDTASAQVQRLDVFENLNTIFYHQSSFDGGMNWSPRHLVPSRACVGDRAYSFVGPVSVVSDQPGRIWLAAKTGDGRVVINRFIHATASWMGWCEIGSHPRAGGVTIAHVSPLPWKGFEIRTYTWNWDSYPAITSWGPGRLDIFMHGRRDDGAITLLHAWRPNEQTGFSWEALGTGLMQGSPAAVSWGPGRIDVFAQGGGGDVAHKYFSGGWWSPWASLDLQITGSPAVISTGPQQLSLYARGTDGALYQRWFGATWFPWESLGGSIVDGIAPAGRDEYTLDVFVLDLYSRIYKKRFFFGWSDYVFQYQSFNRGITAYYWKLL